MGLIVLCISTNTCSWYFWQYYFWNSAFLIFLFSWLVLRHLEIFAFVPWCWVISCKFVAENISQTKFERFWLPCNIGLDLHTDTCIKKLAKVVVSFWIEMFLFLDFLSTVALITPRTWMLMWSLCLCFLAFTRKPKKMVSKQEIISLQAINLRKPGLMNSTTCFFFLDFLLLPLPFCYASCCYSCLHYF